MKKRFIVFFIICFIAGVVSTIAGSAMVDAFDDTSNREARQRWRAIEQSPSVHISKDGGVVFPVTFSDGRDRVYWDRGVSMNLTDYSSFKLDLDCPNPEVMRSLAIYFKSGDGWYIWNKPIHESGRQHVTLLKSDFKTEGSPKGWGYIERIRISPWKGTTSNSELTLYALTAHADGILLVKGTTSVQDPSERKVAAKIAGRVEQLLSDADVIFGVIDDAAVSAGALKHADIAVLPYNPYPDARELAALKAFVKSGGKLLVFYSSSEDLAALMQMKLGDYTKAAYDGQWQYIRFVHPEKWHVPGRIYQESTNIRPVYPGKKSSRVIAYWEDLKGKQQEPALVVSDQGVWMTHVLLNDDAQRKQELLLGLLGHFNPDVLRIAADRALAQAGKIDSFTGMTDVTEYLSKHRRDARHPRRIDDWVAEAQGAYLDMQYYYQKQQYANVIRSERKCRTALLNAYAGVQKPRFGEFRGVWDHDGLGWYPGNWNKTCKQLKQFGMTAIFPNLLWGGLAHYDSDVMPTSDSYRRYGDLLHKSIQGAHHAGLKLHVWIVCWNLGNTTPDFLDAMKQAGRLQKNSHDQTIGWLCPSHPENIRLMLDAIREIVTNYDVDGIHLDYIRFPNSQTCYCPTCHKRFETETGMRVPSWPGDVMKPGKLHDAFVQWRSGVMTEFVHRARKEIQTINPDVKLSAAVFGKYPSCRDSVGQDWVHWVRKGYLDFVCPMNYTVRLSDFDTWTKEQLSYVKDGRGLYPGLGVTASESQLTPDEVIEQILALREIGAGGFMLFDLSDTLLKDTLPALSAGVSRDQ